MNSKTKKRIVCGGIIVLAIIFFIFLTLGIFEGYYTCRITGAKKQERVFYFPFWRGRTRSFVFHRHQLIIPNAISSFIENYTYQEQKPATEWNLDNVNDRNLLGVRRAITPRSPGKYSILNSFNNEGLLYDYFLLRQSKNQYFAEKLSEILHNPQTEGAKKWRSNIQTDYHRFYLETYLLSKDAPGDI